MSFKKIIKSLMPPILFPIASMLYMRFFVVFGNKKPAYRNIVSHSHDELDLNFDNVWESKNWLSHVKKSLIDSFHESPGIHKSAVLKSILILTNMYKHKKLSLFDFGGGCGVIVPHVDKIVNKLNLSISINIVDSFSNIKLGQSYLKEYKNVQFFNQDKVDLNQLMATSESENPVILNMSSVLQYIHPYDEFLSSVLKSKKPKIVCITRFPRCEDSQIDAFAIQDITTSTGFCGSTVVNLFGKDSLINLMNKLGFELLLEEFNSIGDTNYFVNCSDNKFKRMTLVSYTFMAI